MVALRNRASLAVNRSADGMSGIDEIEEMLARAALRDRAAFHALYARTSAKLFGVVLRVLDNRAEAEDALLSR